MSFNPVTDFLALVRQSSAGGSIAEMPGLDYVLAAMARAGMFSLSVGQSAPTTNQSTTVWLKPALPSWSAEGTVFLWNSATSTYEIATAALWGLLFAGSPYLYQAAANNSNIINPRTSLLAVTRAAPSATTLTLPSIGSRLFKPLQIVDWSTGVVAHAISIVPSGVGVTIMKQTSWNLFSTPDQLGGITLQPCPELNAWMIAP